MLRGSAMMTFVHRENLKHLRELLDRTINEAERERICKLLAEEHAKEEPGSHNEESGF